MQQIRASSQPPLNYYEQLGISRSASTKEIRDAFDALGRIYRAGQHSSEDLNSMARLQMERLSRVVEMLSDPVRREAYDLSLDGGGAPVLGRHANSGFPGIGKRTVAYMLVVVALPVTAVLWRRAEVTAPVQAPTVHSTGPVAPRMAPVPKPAVSPRGSRGTAVKRMAQAPRTVKPPAPEPRAAVDQPSDPPPVSAGAQYTLAKEVSDSSITAPTPEIVAPAAPSEPRPASNPSLAGKWLYATRPGDVGKGLYAPLFIELSIQQRAGKIHGRYAAKYEVLDRSISPEVNFRFEGLPSAEMEPAYAWSHTDGSKGEVRLKRLTGESLEVSWITTVFGKASRLASGRAVLYRAE